MNRNYVTTNDKNLYKRNVNSNLVGMNTQFKNVNLYETNKNLITSETLKKYNVIENKGLKSELINRPYKLVLSHGFDRADNGEHTFELNKPLKDVVSVKLQKAFISGRTSSNLSGIDYFILHIDELSKNYSDNTPNKFAGSFAILDNHMVADNSGSGSDSKNYYKNVFNENGDIEYFDPPKNVLARLNVKLFKDDDSLNDKTLTLRLELLIETKEKLKVY
jgi:hypothetical protein